VHIFIDESGTFTILGNKKPHVCCVAALVVPSSREDAFRRDFTAVRETWQDGHREVKGSRLSEKEVAQSIDVAVKHDALLEICAVDTGRHSVEQVEVARGGQAEKLRAAVTERHHPNLVRQIHEMAEAWERLPPQLVIQLYATVRVVAQVIHHAPTYYAQRIPAELASFQWILDRKDRSETPYETLWRQLVCPFLQATSLEDPFPRVKEFDYSHMDRFRADLDRFSHLRPELEARAKADSLDESPPGHIDVVKLVRDGSSFEDSEQSPGLQLVDILANAFARAMNDRLRSDGWRNLGRLMIRQADKFPAQFVEIAMPLDGPLKMLTGRQIRIMERFEERTKSMLV